VRACGCVTVPASTPCGKRRWGLFRFVSFSSVYNHSREQGGACRDREGEGVTAFDSLYLHGMATVASSPRRSGLGMSIE
jgi:hypothetical protein